MNSLFYLFLFNFSVKIDLIRSDILDIVLNLLSLLSHCLGSGFEASLNLLNLKCPEYLDIEFLEMR